MADNPAMPSSAPTSLQWLSFEASDCDDGIATFDAEAAVRAGAPELAALEAEVAAVLAWAHAHLPGVPGPLDEGAAWDVAVQRHDGADGWVTVALTLSGGSAVAEVFRAAYAADGGGDA